MSYTDSHPLPVITQAELQANAAFLERLRKRIKSPSPRDPNRSWHNNPADEIELQMQQDGHHLWGFVIYRTTYDNDAEWTEALHRLSHNYEHLLRQANGDDILAKFKLTVVNDPALLDGASTDDVRRHFQKWAVANCKTEQPTPSQDSQYEFIRLGKSPRYHFAIQIDHDSLRSIIKNAPAPPGNALDCDAWVKVIDKSWYLGRSEYEDEPYEAIDGVTEHDVG